MRARKGYYLLSFLGFLCVLLLFFSSPYTSPPHFYLLFYPFKKN